MRNRNTIIIAIIVVAIVVSSALYEIYIFYPSTMKKEGFSLTTNSFVQSPVGDVVIPKLARNFGGGVSNVPLNMSAGESTNLTVSLYLQIDANVNANFKLLTSPSGSSMNFSSSLISASFEPESLVAIENKNASTVMTVRASSTAIYGEYDAVVFFSDISNSSIVWGSNIQINVAR